MSEFLSMGGYGAFVWASYGISLVIIAAMALAVWLRARDVRRRLDALERRARAASGSVDSRLEEATGNADAGR